MPVTISGSESNRVNTMPDSITDSMIHSTPRRPRRSTRRPAQTELKMPIRYRKASKPTVLWRKLNGAASRR